MKKNLLAASLALALGSMAGVASAAPGPAVAANGVGQINVLPYYSVQDSYNTLMTITNTDTVNGKAVKVRFRAAEWSDDALDFQIFLSPADVWTGAFGILDGKLVLKTQDKSCSLPASLDGQEFTTIRVEGGSVDRLKEGYVEIITMADIPEKLTVGESVSSYQNPLFTAIKHKDGVAPCGTTVTGLLEDSALNPAPVPDELPLEADAAKAANRGLWMVPPAKPSLTSSATIIAVADSKAFTVPATAFAGDNVVFAKKQYFRQTNGLVYQTGSTTAVVGDDQLANLTADNLFYASGAAATNFAGAGYPTYQFDLPDLSTPFTGGVTADEWRNALAAQLQKGLLATDYVIAPSIKASTDILLSQPVRRYFYEYSGPVTDSTAKEGEQYNRTIRDVKRLVRGEPATMYAGLTKSNQVEIGSPVFYDREERTFVSTDDIVVSPQEPGVAAKYYLKGEVSVVSVKNGAGATGALGGRLTNVDWSFTQNYTSGWAILDTVAKAGAATNNQLPLIGFTAINIFNGDAGAAGTNYGQVLPLRDLTDRK